MTSLETHRRQLGEARGKHERDQIRWRPATRPGTTVRRTNAGSTRNTSGNKSFTGTRRACVSARRRNAARSSSASRASCGPTGAPSRSEASNASTIPRSAGESAAAASSADSNPVPSAHARRTGDSAFAARGGPQRTATSTARYGVQPAATATPSRSTTTGSSRASRGFLCAHAPSGRERMHDAQHRVGGYPHPCRETRGTQAIEPRETSCATMRPLRREVATEQVDSRPHAGTPATRHERRRTHPAPGDPEDPRHRHASARTIRRIHNAASASSAIPTTRHTRPTPVPTSTPTAR